MPQHSLIKMGHIHLRHESGHLIVSLSLLCILYSAKCVKNKIVVARRLYSDIDLITTNLN